MCSSGQLGLVVGCGVGWCVVMFFCYGVLVKMFWCFGLDVLVIAVLWSQFEDCYVYFACLVAKKMQEEKQKY